MTASTAIGSRLRWSGDLALIVLSPKWVDETARIVLFRPGGLAVLPEPGSPETTCQGPPAGETAPARGAPAKMPSNSFRFARDLLRFMVPGTRKVAAPCDSPPPAD